MNKRNRILAVIVLAIVALLLFPGYAGSGPDGAWTPADSEAAVRGVNGAISAYEHIRYPDRPVYPPGAPFPVYPTQP